LSADAEEDELSSAKLPTIQFCYGKDIALNHFIFGQFAMQQQLTQQTKGIELRTTITCVFVLLALLWHLFIYYPDIRALCLHAST
jgi:hypothetical protein